MEYAVIPLGAVLAYMGASYLYRAEDLGSYNPRALERAPVAPAVEGRETNPYKQIPKTAIVRKGRGLAVTQATPPKFF
jgi:hypothetical protein